MSPPNIDDNLIFKEIQRAQFLYLFLSCSVVHLILAIMCSSKKFKELHTLIYLFNLKAREMEYQKKKAGQVMISLEFRC